MCVWSWVVINFVFGKDKIIRTFATLDTISPPHDFWCWCCCCCAASYTPKERDPSTQSRPPTPAMMALVWRLLLTLLVSGSTVVVEAFAFTASSTPCARATAMPTLPTHSARLVTDIGTSPALRRCAGGAAAAARPLFPSRGAAAGRTEWARGAKARGNDDDDDNSSIDVLTGSGLRGVDTSKFSGTDKRDADWFQRTAEREARGQLQWFEDPAVYIGLCLLVPVVILFWGVLNCYIPGFCPSTF